jgi:hypothetical protein
LNRFKQVLLEDDDDSDDSNKEHYPPFVMPKKMTNFKQWRNWGVARGSHRHPILYMKLQKYPLEILKIFSELACIFFFSLATAIATSFMDDRHSCGDGGTLHF